MIVVIGAGIIGLAVAQRLSKKHEVILLEKNPKFGQETSSRNSEVVHSGIYYPVNSRKTEWCIAGRHLLYEFLERHSLPYRKCGKKLVATSPEEVAYLEKKLAHCKEVNVPVQRVSDRELFFPESGIFDSHSVMEALESQIGNAKGSVIYHHEVTAIEKRPVGWVLRVKGQEESELEVEQVINCAGLGAAKLSNLALKTSSYEHRFCRGRYFSVSGRHAFDTLVYPVPPKDGLGIHVTLDMAGNVRLGPDVEWTPEIGYDADWEKLRPIFCESARRFWPNLEESRLEPGLVGIRPKLFIDGTAHTDFLVEEKDGFVHCLGIESPGLTASLAIADDVLNLVQGTPR